MLQSLVLAFLIQVDVAPLAKDGYHFSHTQFDRLLDGPVHAIPLANALYQRDMERRLNDLVMAQADSQLGTAFGDGLDPRFKLATPAVKDA